MSYFVIIRGPAAVGKSTITKELARYLKAYYISFDEVMKKSKLDIVEGEGITANNFVKVSKITAIYDGALWILYNNSPCLLSKKN